MANLRGWIQGPLYAEVKLQENGQLHREIILMRAREVQLTDHDGPHA